jgi:hypothetical protein
LRGYTRSLRGYTKCQVILIIFYLGVRDYQEVENPWSMGTALTRSPVDGRLSCWSLRYQVNFNFGAAPVAEQTKEDSLPDNRCWSFLEIQTAVGGTGKQKF